MLRSGIHFIFYPLYFVTLTEMLELVTILGSFQSGRYFSELFVTFQPMFSGSQVRVISKFIMLIVVIKNLVLTRIGRPGLAGENDVVSLVNCGWSSDLNVFTTRGD